jgi:glycosyltransferase involved in cell wall biosynthesis
MLSIITINKNNAIGLEKTLRSLQAQSLQNFQWIFIDGNSYDSSNEIAKNFSKSNDVLISSNDSGIYNAMNSGILHITGDRVIFLNSGDELSHHGALQKVEEEWRADLDLLLLGFRVGGRNRMPRGNWWRYWSMPTSHQAIVYSTNLLRKEKFDESFKFAADFEHYLRINQQLINIKIVPEIFALNEPYGSDSHLQSVLREYHDALIKNGYSKHWAKFSFFIKTHYLKYALKQTVTLHK